MENRDAELETKAFAERWELVLAGRTQLNHTSPTFCSWASLGWGRAHLQRGSRRQAGVVLQQAKGKVVLLAVLGGAGNQRGASQGSDGGPELGRTKPTQPRAVQVCMPCLLDGSAGASSRAGQPLPCKGQEGSGALSCPFSAWLNARRFACVFA